MSKKRTFRHLLPVLVTGRNICNSKLQISYAGKKIVTHPNSQNIKYGTVKQLHLPPVAYWERKSHKEWSKTRQTFPKVNVGHRTTLVLGRTATVTTPTSLGVRYIEGRTTGIFRAQDDFPTGCCRMQFCQGFVCTGFQGLNTKRVSSNLLFILDTTFEIWRRLTSRCVHCLKSL